MIQVKHIVALPFLIVAVTLFARDRFHPSSAGYARITAALTPTVLAAARARRDAAA